MDESGDSYEPLLPDAVDLPKKPSVPPPPLQRLWKAPAEIGEAAEPAPKQPPRVEEPPPPTKARPKQPLFIEKKKKAEPKSDDGTGATGLEPTPVLDTVESRQRARWLIGGLVGAIVVIFGSILVGMFKGDPIDEIRDGELPDPRLVSDVQPTVKPNVEAEARNLLDLARQANKAGKIDAAKALLAKLLKVYPKTEAAREAIASMKTRNPKDPAEIDKALNPSGPSKKGADAPSAVAGGPTPPSTNGPSPISSKNAAEPAQPADQSTRTQPPAIVAAPPPPQLKPLPIGYRPDFTAPIHPSGWPTRIFSDRDGAELVLIPAGAFDMGRGDGDSQEGPVHPVSLSAYYIDKHEVTVRQYSRFLKESGRPLDAVRKGRPKSVTTAEYENYPITGISWKEADSFCDWARRSLPTEAQWELAARSTDGRISYWNGELPRKDPEKGPRVMQPVMSLPTDLSQTGVFDLGANAWEWTADLYDSQYYQQFRNLAIDPPGPSRKARSGLLMMAVRGGSKAGFLTWREGLKTETRAPYLGFRGVLNVEASPAAPAPPAGPANVPPAGPNRPGGNAGPI